MYCLLREAVKQRTPIKAGCRTKDMMQRYERRGKAVLTVKFLSQSADAADDISVLALKSRQVALVCLFCPVFLSGHEGCTAD